MKRIVVYKLTDEIPENAQPIGAVANWLPPKRPGEAPEKEILFYYEISDQDAAKKEKRK